MGKDKKGNGRGIVMKIDADNIKDEMQQTHKIFMGDEVLDIWDSNGKDNPRLIMQIKTSRKTSLKWKDVPKFKDEDYFYPIVQMQESGNDLHFKFTPFRGSKERKSAYMVIENYRKNTALEIMDGLEQIGFNTRHSYDAVMKFYKDKGLDLGFVRKTLKDIRL